MNKLYVVGMGPGGIDEMTTRAYKALSSCEVIAGYTVYVDLLRQEFRDKEFIVTPMRKEIERCQLALGEADKGRVTAMVCSGDAGVYGMAELILRLQENYPNVDVEIIPGVTAALSGAAVLGAPLIHDFAVISLSDLMTPLQVIQERLRAAGQGDFVVCLYNPSSKKRADYLEKACDILLEYKKEDTVCGYVRQIGRQGQEVVICTLKELRQKKVDMFTTVFVGNQKTMHIGNHMITPRGYTL